MKDLDKAFLSIKDVLRLFFLGYLFSVLFTFGLFFLFVKPSDSFIAFFLMAMLFSFFFFSLPFLASFGLVDYDAKKRIKDKSEVIISKIGETKDTRKMLRKRSN